MSSAWGFMARAALNSVLGLVLLGQVVLAILIWRGASFSIPQDVVSRAQKALRDEGWDVTWAEARLGANARVWARGVQARSLDEPRLSITAQDVEFRWNGWALLLGNAFPSQVVVSGAAADWAGERLVADLYGRVRVTAESAYLPPARAEVMGVPVLAQGIVPLASLRAPADGAGSVGEALGSVLAALEQTRSWVDRQEGPRLSLTIGPEATLRVVADVDQLRLPEGWRVREGRLMAQVGWDPSLALSRWDFQAREVVGPEVRADELFVAAERHHQLAFPLDAVATARRLRYRGWEASWPRLRADASGYPLAGTIDGRFRVAGGAQEVRARVFVNESADVWARLLLPVDFLTERFPDVGEFVANGRVEAEGRASFGSGFSFEKAAFTFREEAMVIQGVPFPWARGWGRWDGTLLDVYRLEAEIDARQFATGSYRQDFATSAFVLRAEGQVFPPSLNNLIGDFYDALWEDIQATEDPVSADVLVAGRWENKDSIGTWMSAQGTRIRYLDKLTDEVWLRLHQQTGYVTLPYLRVTQGGGELVGGIDWRFPREPGGNERLTLDVNSTVPLDSLATIFGDEASLAAEVLAFERNPRVYVGGFVTQNAEDEVVDRDVRILISGGGFVDVGSLRFDWIDLRGRLRPGVVEEMQLRAGLWGGTLMASGGLGTEDSQTFRVDARLTDAKGDLLLGYLETATGSRPWAGGGTASAHLSLRGTRGGYEGWEGEGGAALVGADLRQVHLLGGLSRLLDTAGLGLTTLSFTDFSADLRWEGPRLRLDPAQLGGAGVAITANGTVDLEKEFLDLNAGLRFETESVPPLGGLANLVLAPLRRAFEFELSGPWDDLSWRLRYSPFDLFREEPEAPAANPDSPAE